MKILKNLARSMICVAAGLLLYCGSFYIKSYEQNKTAREKNQYVEQLAYAGSYAAVSYTHLTLPTSYGV